MPICNTYVWLENITFPKEKICEIENMPSYNGSLCFMGNIRDIEKSLFTKERLFLSVYCTIMSKPCPDGHKHVLSFSSSSMSSSSLVFVMTGWGSRGRTTFTFLALASLALGLSGSFGGKWPPNSLANSAAVSFTKDGLLGWKSQPKKSPEYNTVCINRYFGWKE